MTKLTRIVPVIVTALCALWLATKAMPARDADGAFEVQGFARMPVVYQGRVKPFDTLARNSLIIISDRQTWRDADGEKRPAIEWLLDVMSNTPRAADHKVFRIHNHQLLTQLGLERRRGYRFSYAEIEGALPEIEQQAMHASHLEPDERDVYDVMVLEFWRKVIHYHVLAETHLVPSLGDDPHGGLDRAIQRLERLERFSLPHAIPPVAEDGEWSPMLRAVLAGAMTQTPSPVIRPLAGVLAAWRDGNAVEFNEHLAAYRVAIDEAPVLEGKPLAFETFFNGFTPFYNAAVLYVLAFLLSCVGWLGWTEGFRRTTFWLLSMIFVVHVIAIASRVYISGYPPITNLYGTAVFIGCGGVLLGLALERTYPIGVGNILASITGFITLLIAHFLAGDGDTLEMMQAVLDTKFWLATHVIIINFGYSATFVAAGLACLYLLRGVLTPTVDADTERMFGRMIYGVVCFGLLLSFLGTVLGGLWADDSWGRFWGWDPKENGALMIVLWNALILHARWGGVVRTRGLAELSVFGGIITAWSWFGVNQLGVGLHSYGFTDSVTFWLLIFAASQLLVMGLGLLPRHIWRSQLPTTRRAKPTFPLVLDETGPSAGKGEEPE